MAKTNNNNSRKRVLTVVALLAALATAGADALAQTGAVAAQQVQKEQQGPQHDDAAIAAAALNPEGFDLEDSNNEPETDALRRAFYGSIFSSGLYVADAQGVIVAIDPGSQKAIGVSIRNRPDAMTALNSGLPAVSGYAGGAAGHDAVVSMAVPVRNRSGQVVGVIGGDVGLSEGLLGEIIRSAAPGKDAYAQVVDSRGTIIASTRPQQMLKTSDHAAQIANLIAERRAVSSACHSCQPALARSACARRHCLPKRAVRSSSPLAP